MTLATYTCTRCSVTEEEELHILPLGWDNFMGDDYCEACMKELNAALAPFFKKQKAKEVGHE